MQNSNKPQRDAARELGDVFDFLPVDEDHEDTDHNNWKDQHLQHCHVLHHSQPVPKIRKELPHEAGEPYAFEQQKVHWKEKVKSF